MRSAVCVHVPKVAIAMYSIPHRIDQRNLRLDSCTVYWMSANMFCIFLKKAINSYTSGEAFILDFVSCVITSFLNYALLFLKVFRAVFLSKMCQWETYLDTGLKILKLIFHLI